MSRPYGGLVPGFPTHPAARSLAVAALIDWTGTGLWLAASTLFFVRVVHLEPAQIGLGLAAAGSVGVAAVMPVTSLTRRWPAAPVAAVLQVARGLAFLTYLGVHSAATFFVAAVLVAVVDRPAATVIQVLVGRVVSGEERSRTMAALHMASNLGAAAGAALAALALLRADRSSFDVVVVADAASFLVAAWLVARIARRWPESEPATEPAPPRRRLALTVPARDPRFVLLSAGNGLLAVHMPLLNVLVPLWLVQRTTAPLALMGCLYAVNTLLVVGVQLPIARSVTGVRDGVRAAWTAAVCVAACGGALSLAAQAQVAGAIALLVLAAVLCTLAEVHQNAAAWALSFGCSPPGRSQSVYLGFFGTGQAAMVVLGPALLTLLLSRQGSWMFVTLAGLVLAGSLGVTLGRRPVGPGDGAAAGAPSGSRAR